MTEPFKPAWWLPGPHLQTLWAPLFRRKSKDVAIKRERFVLSDGDFIDIDWANASYKKTVLILHGLEGSIDSAYAHGLLSKIARNFPWRVGVMHFRSCSGAANLLPRFYHSGDTQDLAEFVEHIHKQINDLAIVGFSLGANVLLKWLGETGAQSTITAACAVSTPFDLLKCVFRLQTGFSVIYDRYLLGRLRKKLNFKFNTGDAPRYIPNAQYFKSLYDFDHHVTAPLHGFKSAKDYYRRASCRPYLKNIQIPTLLLQSRDDPFMQADVIPDASELSDKIQLEVHERGGHVGFVSGHLPWKPEYWLETRIPNFLAKFF